MVCQELTCELSVKQLGAGSVSEDKCSPLEEKRAFKEYWDTLRYFKENLTCPETAENCPSDCGSEAKSDLQNARAVGRDYVQNLSEYRLYGGSNVRDLSDYGEFSRGFYENGTSYYNLGYWFEVRTEKIPWDVSGYTVNLTTFEGRVINVTISNYTNSQ